MVEGHSVHRVASLHRKKLCGRNLKASSPNGRFAAGAAAIDGKTFRSIEAVGKVRALYYYLIASLPLSADISPPSPCVFYRHLSAHLGSTHLHAYPPHLRHHTHPLAPIHLILIPSPHHPIIPSHPHPTTPSPPHPLTAPPKNLFAFFGGRGASEGGDAAAALARPPTEAEEDPADPVVCVHVHFGMSGRWGVFTEASAPPPTPTTRLTLTAPGLVCHLSAMTVDSGGMDMYRTKRAKLGADPLNPTADVEALWARVSNSRMAISKLLMDQVRYD